MRAASLRSGMCSSSPWRASCRRRHWYCSRSLVSSSSTTRIGPTPQDIKGPRDRPVRVPNGIGDREHGEDLRFVDRVLTGRQSARGLGVGLLTHWTAAFLPSLIGTTLPSSPISGGLIGNRVTSFEIR